MSDHRYALYLTALCKREGWPAPEAEQVLIPGRRFRCDFVWRAARVVLEVNGGAFIQGRHSRGMGQIKDWEKLNLVQLAGYRVFQVSPKQVTDGTVQQLLARVFAEGGPHASEQHRA